MKVLCIKEPLHNIARESRGSLTRAIPTPVIGNEYTVVDKIEVDDVSYYELAEFPPEGDNCFYYWVNWFAPLSDIDEAELINKNEMAYESNVH